MMDTKLDLPFLQALLLGCKIVNISVGYVVCLSEESALPLDYILRQLEQSSVILFYHATIQNMIVVFAVVETD